jgi:hypothetical protein
MGAHGLSASPWALAVRCQAAIGASDVNYHSKIWFNFGDSLKILRSSLSLRKDIPLFGLIFFQIILPRQFPQTIPSAKQLHPG